MLKSGGLQQIGKICFRSARMNAHVLPTLPPPFFKGAWLRADRYL
jgi:hypothetical protein